MKKKLCRALGILLSITMLSGEMGSFSVWAAGDEQEVSAEEESGGNTVSEDDADSENTSENEAEPEEGGKEAASENDAEAEEGSSSENEAEAGSSDESSPENQADNEEDVDGDYEDDKEDNDYKILDESKFKILSNNVEVGSYSATAKVEATHEYSSYSSLVAIYTAKEDADFFAGEEYITSVSLNNAADYKYSTGYESSKWIEDDNEEDGYYIYDYSIKIGNNSSTLLTPDTTYRYRLAAYYYDNNETDYRNKTKYYFVSAPQSFKTGPEVTESKVNIGEINTDNHGYYKANISVSVNNPDNETIGTVQVVEKTENDKDARVISTLSYNNKNNNYTGVLYKNDNELQIRIGVYIGKGELGYIYKDIVQDFYDDKDVKASVSVNGTTMSFTVNGSLSPYYEIDGLNASLYYQASGSSSWNQNTGYFKKDGSFTVSPSEYYIKPETEYNYYIDIGYYNNGYKTVKSFGSEDEPYGKFTTGTLITYNETDFKDPGLYAYLKGKYGEGKITNVKLEALTDLNIYNSNSDNIFVIKSLDDFPEKMPNLTSISMESQDVADITPLLKLKELRTVYMEYNDVATLPDLSGVKWESLDLNYNLLTEDAVAKAKAPESLKIYRTPRKNSFNTAEVYYIDSDGVYPIILEYLGKKSGRKYTVSVSLNNITKEYSEWNYYNQLIIKTAKDDFGLESGKKYTAKIVINDGFSDVVSTERSFEFAPLAEDVSDYYTTSGADSVYVEFYLPSGEYASDAFSGIFVVQNEKIYFSNNDIYSYSTDRRYDLYKNVFESSSISGLDYKSYRISSSLSMVRIPAAGDYDLVLVPKEGEKLVWKNKIHVTEEAVVTGLSYSISGYDNRGEYFYIELDGYNLKKEDVYPYICDENGDKYTTVDDVIRKGSSRYIYRLKKNANWDEINEAPDGTYYFIKLDGKKFIDKRENAENKISVSYLKDGIAINYHPIQGHYNWKKQTFELTFDSTVKKDTKLVFEFFSDSSREDMTATAEAVVGDNGLVSVKPLNADGSTHIPGKEGQEFTQYYNIIVGDEKIETELDVIWYNKYNNGGSPSSDNEYLNMTLSKTFIAAPAESLEVTVNATSKKHSTNNLTARIKDTGEKIALKYKKENSYDRFESGSWKFTSALPVGTYTVEVFESVDGKEVILATSYIYVRDKSVFYTDYCTCSFDSKDPTVATARIDIPLADIPDSEKEDDLNKAISKLKLKVEVFDADLNPVKDLKITPTKGVKSYGGLFFKISGLNKDELCYYVRITSDDKTPLDIYYEGREYYNDPAHGTKMSRSINFYLYDSNEYMAYYYLRTYDLNTLPPFTVNFYAASEPSKLVQSINVKKEALDGGYYYFTAKDIEKLDASTVYDCVIISNNQRVRTYKGYFAAKGHSTPITDPNKITLKVNKKENITATLNLNTNGADPVSPLYTKAKSGKTAKMAKLTKKGHSFKGWYVSYTDKKGNTKQKKVTSITASIIKKYASGGAGGTLSLKAEFKPNSYTVKFNKTGKFEGKKVKTSGKIKNEKIQYTIDGVTVNNVTIKGTELTLKDASLELKGWTTTKNGTEVMFAVGEKVSLEKIVPAKGTTINLYAVYGKKE